MSKDIIVNLIGASGSGKTTIAQELDNEGFNIIQSYTNRKPRYDNEWGHTFIDKFVKIESPLVTFERNGETKQEEYIAYFNNYEKHEHYFATRDQYEGEGTSIYIVDSAGARQVKEIVKDIKVITIYLVSDELIRKERLLNSRDLEEVSTRLKRDREIFNRVYCDYAINADRRPKEVLDDILHILLNL